MQNTPLWSRPMTQRDLQADANVLAERLEYFREREPTHTRSPIQQEHLQPPWPAEVDVPEIPASELDVAKLRSAIASKGSLIVRGLIDPPTTRYYKSVIDAVLSTCYEDAGSSTTPGDARTVFRNPPDNLEKLNNRACWKDCRHFHKLSGSAMVIESASVAEQLLELYASLGLRELIAAYLGEAPCLSAQKWVLRRSKLPVQAAGWHQDGAFMGPEINTINMWVSLDECGDDTGAPGLDVVPRRLKELVGPGEAGAAFEWSVGESFVHPTVVRSPVFGPGDAYFFDHFFLHRTQYREDFSRLRYAIETWFFGVGNFSKEQMPLLW